MPVYAITVVVVYGVVIVVPAAEETDDDDDIGGTVPETLELEDPCADEVLEDALFKSDIAYRSPIEARLPSLGDIESSTHSALSSKCQ